MRIEIVSSKFSPIIRENITKEKWEIFKDILTKFTDQNPNTYIHITLVNSECWEAINRTMDSFFIHANENMYKYLNLMIEILKR